MAQRIDQISPQMGSVVPLGQRSISTGTPSPAQQRLVPADGKALRNELTSCLVLVAPVGMDQDAQNAWLTAAGLTLSGIPADLLTMGCVEARRFADHPSRVVPAIMRAVESLWSARKRELDADRPVLRIAAPAPEYVDPAVAAKIIDDAGLRDPHAVRSAARPEGPMRAPSAAEMAAMFPRASDADDVPVANIEGMTLEQILAQAHRLKSERLSRSPAERRQHANERRAASNPADEFENMDRYFA